MRWLQFKTGWLEWNGGLAARPRCKEAEADSPKSVQEVDVGKKDEKLVMIYHLIEETTNQVRMIRMIIRIIQKMGAMDDVEAKTTCEV